MVTPMRLIAARVMGGALTLSLLLECGGDAPSGSTEDVARPTAGAPNDVPAGAGAPAVNEGSGGAESDAGTDARGGEPGARGDDAGTQGGEAGADHQQTDGTPRTPEEIVAELGVGWCLGNSLEAFGVPDETGWGNPRTTPEMIETVRARGFRSLRLPVSYDDHYSSGSVDGDYRIDPAWLDRIEEVVGYGLVVGMSVIVNVHHADGWADLTPSNEARASERLSGLWAQLAQRFAGYGDRVIFELMNEPRVEGDWEGDTPYYEVLNRVNAAAVKAIRGEGSRNTTRLILVPGYAASPHAGQLASLVLPDDEYIALSVHGYLPYYFALDPNGSGVLESDFEIGRTFDYLKTRFVDRGVAVVMGEWGSVDKDNLEERVAHAREFVASARRANIPAFWWDNNNFDGYGGDKLGLLDRSTLTWRFTPLLDAILEGASR